ncbi:MAG TPA: HAMP domain-containing sensor histidine kinase [Polyangiaceae bacterium]|jgi:signal transduction histidine kinase
MAAHANDGWLFDSALAPSPRPNAKIKSVRPPENSTVELMMDENIVALSLDRPALDELGAALACTNLMVLGDIGVESAAVVIADVGAAGDVRARVASLRKRMRADAALLLVSPVASAEIVRQTHEAGALACLRPPLVMEEVLSFVRSALDSRAAKSQAADLARKLDLDAHLASIGRISAGLSHEISTPLLVAQTNLETIREDCTRLMQVVARFTPDLEELRELPEVLEETRRAHDRLRAVLEMMRELVGRRRASNAERIDLLRAAHETRVLLASALADVELTIVGDPVVASADGVLLGQILQNLVANAAQAAKTLSSPRVRVHAYAHGDRSIVSVRDNGPGIPIEMHDKIFEPFYTTRRGRGGTGLGLALCREYAVQMNAEISLWSLPGRGACFRVSLPRA